MNEFEIEPEDPFQVADDLKAGIESAFNEIGINIDVPADNEQAMIGFYPDNIKVNKIAYQAIEEMGLPLIRTWYRYGQYEPYISLRADELEPKPLQQPNKKVAVMDTGATINRKTIHGFFMSQESKLKRIWEQNLFDFMRSNYADFAPPAFKDVYFANTGVMEEIENTFTERSDGFWIDTESFLDASMDLRYELNSTPNFTPETKDHMKESLRLFEDALTALETKDEKTEEYMQFFRNSRSLYHNYVWKLPAMEISVENTKGPDGEVDNYNDQRREYLKKFRRTFPKHISGWEKSLKQLELTSTANTYRSVYGNSSSAVGALAKAAVYYHESN